MAFLQFEKNLKVTNALQCMVRRLHSIEVLICTAGLKLNNSNIK